MKNWKGRVRKWSWPNLRQSRHLHESTEKNNENIQDSRSPGLDLKPEPPEYEAGVLTTRPRRSVMSIAEKLENGIIFTLNTQKCCQFLQ
jgi:hypothetical protein